MKKGWLIASLLTLVVIGAGVGGAISYGSDDKLPEGFNVGGLTVGGQTADSALKQIQIRLDELEKVEITVTPPTVNGMTGRSFSDATRTLKQLGMNVDISDAVKAIEKFRDVSWWDRARFRYQKKIKTDYGMQITWDEDQFRKEAASSWSSAAGSVPKAATRTINEQDEVVYTPEVIGTELDTPALLAKVKAFEPKSLSSLSSGSDTKHSIELPVTQTTPEVTLAKLQEEGIERKIVEFTTSFSTSGQGRTHNVTVAAKALNETLLMPDEIFEYGKIVDKADKEYGYKEAPVIVKGKLTPGVGGGICQVSSTLYNAALLSGLEIVERRNHSLVVHYLPKGLDATFADGYVNFKFRNSTGKQLLIRTVVKDKTLTVKLFGTMPDNISYRTETVEVKENPPKTVYVADNKLALGKQDTLQKGESGYVIESYRIKLVNGEVAERKKLSKDTYRSQDSLIAVNPNDPRLNPEGISPTPSPSPAPGDEGPVEPV
ncbi:VanW family protein [Cohnella silvisoli]|uniref:VanW family protein n=1 Tax=Cohnella silvisoli TaxID=2873699 RepID=A0ABV1KPI4_9BACL|nr:VanW family protein [Cohnella silvisoli]MCD9022340.1 VanW family protein [Cohnella silvisoli]